MEGRFLAVRRVAEEGGGEEERAHGSMQSCLI